MHLFHPIAQRIHNQLNHARVFHIKRRAATGRVFVITRIIPAQSVINGIVYTAERQGNPHLVAFARVVIDNVHKNLYSGIMKDTNHILDFAKIRTCHIKRVRCKITDRIVSPIVMQTGF